MEDMRILIEMIGGVEANCNGAEMYALAHNVLCNAVYLLLTCC